MKFIKPREEPKQPGFTIVELLIVIVVIGILAAITIVAYNGIQQRARDTQRKSDITTMAKALELYYIDNDSFPPGSGSTSINSGWSTTADSSWPNLETTLKSYVSRLPRDPISTQTGAGAFPWNDPAGYDYSYVATSGYCGITPNTQPPQMYLIVYKFEGTAQTNSLTGTCSSNSLLYAGSNYRVVK